MFQGQVEPDRLTLSSHLFDVGVTPIGRLSADCLFSGARHARLQSRRTRIPAQVRTSGFRTDMHNRQNDLASHFSYWRGVQVARDALMLADDPDLILDFTRAARRS